MRVTVIGIASNRATLTLPRTKKKKKIEEVFLKRLASSSFGLILVEKNLDMI